MTHLAGTDLTLEIPLLNDSGEPIDATGVEYKVVDGNGAVVLATQTVSGFAGGSEVSITIPAAANTLTDGRLKDAREIEFVLTLADGSKSYANHIYFLEVSTGRLVRGSNSFVTLGSAEMLANGTSNLRGWPTATKGAKTNALLEAYQRIGKLRIECIGSICDLEPYEVLALDMELMIALAQAQVIEADSILAGDSYESRRADGLVLETVGEVKQMFRNTKPVDLPVSRRTLSVLSRFTSVGAKVIGRA